MRKKINKESFSVLILCLVVAAILIGFYLQPVFLVKPVAALSLQDNNYGEPEAALDSAILAAMAEDHIVGLSAAFVKDGKVIWANGYGWADFERQKKTTPDTIYRIASISKAITATALMQLWEQGKFGLDDDISTYLGFNVRNPAYPHDQITFRMLLTHTSGILDGSSQGGYLQAISSGNPPALKDLLLPGGKAYSFLTWGAYQPGSDFNYSNFGSGIIACLVEKISGERFDRYALNHIFKPLGMDASYEVADLTNIDRLAVLYKPTTGHGNFIPAADYFQEGERPKPPAYALPLGNDYLGPAGGVRASVTDLAKFMIAHMNGGVYNGIRILNRGTADLMHQMQWFGNGLEGFYRQKGLNFHITDALAGRRLTGHAGAAYGLVSDMYFNLDENTGVIFMTNGGDYQLLDNGFTNIENDVINQVFEQLAGSAKPVTRKIKVAHGENKLVVNGRAIVYPVPADVQGEEIFVPAITIADALEAEIDCDVDTHTLTLSKSSKEVKLKAGEASLVVNGVRHALGNAPYLKNSKIMLPLKKVARAFGANVADDPVHQTTNIILEEHIS